MRMVRMLSVLVVLAMLTGIKGCNNVENNARDAAAALGGVVTAAQSQHQDECAADKQAHSQLTLDVCKKINQGVAGENALITAIETYCGWSTSAPPADLNATCTPVKSAQAALEAAINNANQLTSEIKSAVQAQPSNQPAAPQSTTTPPADNPH